MRKRFSKSSHPPPGRRYCALAAYENFVHCHLRSISVALAPPKPNELDKAYSNAASAGLLTTWKAHKGSGVSNVVVGGTHCSRKAIRQTSASTAPAPPSR